jgi:hypothetical protein
MADFALASRYLPVSKPGMTAMRQASFVTPSFLVRSKAPATDLRTVLLSVSTAKPVSISFRAASSLSDGDL